MSYKQRDSSLYLQNALDRIEDMKQLYDDKIIIQNLLYELYHYNINNWSELLHKIIIQIINYSIKNKRYLNNELEYYYFICSKSDNIQPFKNVINCINIKIKENIDMLEYNNYTEIQECIGYEEKCYRYMLTFTNDDTSLFIINILYKNCVTYRSKGLFIRLITQYCNIFIGNVSYCILQLKYSIYFNCYLGIISSIEVIEEIISKEVEIDQEYYDLLLDLSVKIKDYLSYTYLLLKKDIKNPSDIIISYLHIDDNSCDKLYKLLIKNRTINVKNLLEIIHSNTIINKVHPRLANMIDKITYEDFIWLIREYNDVNRWDFNIIYQKVLKNLIISNSVLSIEKVSNIGIKNQFELISRLRNLNIYSIYDKKEKIINFYTKSIEQSEKYINLNNYKLEKNNLISELKHKFENNQINLKNIRFKENIILQNKEKEKAELIRKQILEKLEKEKTMSVEKKNLEIENEKIIKIISDKTGGKVNNLQKLETRKELLENSRILLETQRLKEENLKIDQWNYKNWLIKIILEIELPYIKQNRIQNNKLKREKFENFIKSKKIKDQEKEDERLKRLKRFNDIKEDVELIIHTL